MRIDFAPTEGITGYLFRVIHHKYFSGADHYFMPFCSPAGNEVQVCLQLVDAAADGRTALIQKTDNGIFIVVGFQPCADG